MILANRVSNEDFSAFLQSRSLATSGKKMELVSRILLHLAGQPLLDNHRPLFSAMFLRWHDVRIGRFNEDQYLHGRVHQQCVEVLEDDADVFDFSAADVRTRFVQNPQSVVVVSEGINKSEAFPPPDLVTAFLQIYHPQMIVQAVHIDYVYDVLMSSDQSNKLFAAFYDALHIDFFLGQCKHCRLQPCVTIQVNPPPTWLQAVPGTAPAATLRHNAYRAIREGLGAGIRKPVPSCCLLAIRVCYMGYPITGFRVTNIAAVPELPDFPDLPVIPIHTEEDMDEGQENAEIQSQGGEESEEMGEEGDIEDEDDDWDGDYAENDEEDVEDSDNEENEDNEQMGEE